MGKLHSDFSIDPRVMRVVLASSDPLQTMQNINSGKISIRALLDTLEILDAKSTIEEHEMKAREQRTKESNKR